MTVGRREPASIYADVIGSFALGMVRLLGAEAASARLKCALLAYRTAPEEATAEGPYSEVLGHLRKIPYSSYDALRYITDVSHLVYATTLLDTFLSDTTLFLLLLFPQAMGKNHQVPLSSLLAAPSRAQVLTDAAIRKAREIGYLAFTARLSYLRDTFGLPIVLSSDVAEALDHYPSIRNSAVHDQGVFEIALDDGGGLVSRQKTCFRHPTPVQEADIDGALRAYKEVVSAVASDVMSQVLKAPNHPVLRSLIQHSPAQAALPEEAGGARQDGGDA